MHSTILLSCSFQSLLRNPKSILILCLLYVTLFWFSLEALRIFSFSFLISFTVMCLRVSCVFFIHPALYSVGPFNLEAHDFNLWDAFLLFLWRQTVSVFCLYWDDYMVFSFLISMWWITWIDFQMLNQPCALEIKLTALLKNNWHAVNGTCWTAQFARFWLMFLMFMSVRPSPQDIKQDRKHVYMSIALPSTPYLQATWFCHCRSVCIF